MMTASFEANKRRRRNKKCGANAGWIRSATYIQVVAWRHLCGGLGWPAKSKNETRVEGEFQAMDPNNFENRASGFAFLQERHQIDHGIVAYRIQRKVCGR
jgi:hypothetical protein